MASTVFCMVEVGGSPLLCRLPKLQGLLAASAWALGGGEAELLLFVANRTAPWPRDSGFMHGRESAIDAYIRWLWSHICLHSG